MYDCFFTQIAYYIIFQPTFNNISAIAVVVNGSISFGIAHCPLLVGFACRTKLASKTAPNGVQSMVQIPTDKGRTFAEMMLHDYMLILLCVMWRNMN